MLGGDVEALEFQRWSIVNISGTPAHDTHQPGGVLGECYATSAAEQPLTPASLTVIDADPVEVLLRNESAVRLAPAVRLELRDAPHIRRLGITHQSDTPVGPELPNAH